MGSLCKTTFGLRYEPEAYTNFFSAYHWFYYYVGLGGWGPRKSTQWKKEAHNMGLIAHTRGKNDIYN